MVVHLGHWTQFITAKVEAVVEQPQPEIIKIEAPEMEQLKVIDKIDLSAIDSSTRPKKAAGKGTKKETPAKEIKAKQKTVIFLSCFLNLICFKTDPLSLF